VDDVSATGREGVREEMEDPVGSTIRKTVITELRACVKRRRTEPMLSLRSLVLAVGIPGIGISKRDEAEEWPEIAPESVAPPARLTGSGGGRVVVLEDGKDVVRECIGEG
jgi:hypothetical protein